MNQATLLGRLGKDPETRQVNDTTVTDLVVATSKKWKDKNGEMQEKTEWHRCQAWGRTGEVLAQYLTKGDPVFIQGEIETRSYEKDGEKRYATSIRVSNFEFVPAKAKDASGGASSAKEGSSYKRPEGVPNMAPGADMNEEIPF